jgi:hypothetical protein
MSKRMKLLSLTVAMILMLVAGNLAAMPSWGPEPAYYATFYSDDTYQTVVGYTTPQCHPFYGVLNTLSGTHTAYVLFEYAFTCFEESPY